MLQPRFLSNIVRLALMISTLVFLDFVNHVHADNAIVVRGDEHVLKDTFAIYRVSIPADYPRYVQFKYIFSINLPKPQEKVIYSDRFASWQCDFNDVPVGKYSLNIQVYLYVITLGWKIGETTINVNVEDNLNNFFAVKGSQDGLPSYTRNNVFATNRTVNLTAQLVQPNTFLSDPKTQLNFTWKMKDLNVTFTNRTFSYNLTQKGDYDWNVDVNASFELNAKTMLYQGHLSDTIQARVPLANLTFDGNSYVKDGRLFKLNVSWCGASPNFEFCYDFSHSNPSNVSCFDSPITLTRCYYKVVHYFPYNGTEYVNLGVRNDVSELPYSIKITIYKVGPQQSVLFVIVPLVGTVAVLVIAVSGVAYHVKQRTRLNATIEEATADNIGIYQPADEESPMLEKSFTARICESFHVSLR